MSAQIPDKIVIEGGECKQLYSNPLENYWNNQGKKKPVFLVSPECRRGYIALWMLKNNQLFLQSIEGTFKRWYFWTKRFVPYTLNKLFPKSHNKLVKASWFSGKLRIPQGKMTLFEDHEYDSRFERELIITIEKGEVLKIVTLDYTQKKLTVTLDEL